MKNLLWIFLAVCIMGVQFGCASPPPPPIAPTRLETSQDQATIHALQKRLQDRERTVARQKYQIEVMSSQLEALKRIDQDTSAQRLPMRNSVIVAP